MDSLIVSQTIVPFYFLICCQVIQPILQAFILPLEVFILRHFAITNSLYIQAHYSICFGSFQSCLWYFQNWICPRWSLVCLFPLHQLCQIGLWLANSWHWKLKYIYSYPTPRVVQLAASNRSCLFQQLWPPAKLEVKHWQSFDSQVIALDCCLRVIADSFCLC